jgi:hypothetical protein
MFFAHAVDWCKIFAAMKNPNLKMLPLIIKWRAISVAKEVWLQLNTQKDYNDY